ncbi:MAG: hypothetical protein FWE33_04130 [Defluviitaleaceae bacterium]|nr:hypothetical protein [Defluviitaleaceae bacterium]
MKKLITILLALLVLVACNNNAEPDEIDNTNDIAVLVDFLSQFTTLYTDVARALTDWDNDRWISVPTGQYIIGNEPDTWQPILTDITPQIHFSPDQNGQFGFRDENNELITNAIWIQHENYADYFRLFDFGDEYPVIFMHYSQTFDGGYAGGYRIFRYVDGAYRMLEMVDGWIGWLGRVHHLFLDDYGRVIVFVNSEYHDVMNYSHLVLTDTRAELNIIASMDGNWEQWQEYHWSQWNEVDEVWQMVDGWLLNNPTIFGTDIGIAPIESLVDLENEILSSIIRRNTN